MLKSMPNIDFFKFLKRNDDSQEEEENKSIKTNDEL